MVSRTSFSSVSVLATAMSLAVSAQGQGNLEEVMVTAEKREQSLQDVPIAISAFTNDDLRQQLVDRPLDLQLNVPNMLMSKGNFTTAAISIRGVGNLAIGSAADSGTGIHINGFYMNGPRVFEMDFFDVDRVEVLRGPQGTLYGRNTTAGVLNMITAKPDTEALSGNINGEFGNYSRQRYEGYVNFPLGDSAAQRFSGFYLTQDGFVDNAYNGEDVDDRDMFGIRSSTLFENDSTSAQLVINYLEEDDNRMRGSDQRCTKDTNTSAFGQYGPLGCLPSSLENSVANTSGTVLGAITAGIEAATFGLLTFPADDYANPRVFDDPRRQWLDTTPRYQVEDTVVTFEISHDFGDFTLTSLTGYHDTSFSAANDYDFTQASETWDWIYGELIGGFIPNPLACTPSAAEGFCQAGGVPVDRGVDGVEFVDRLYSTDLSTTEGEEYSQELRLSSDWDGPLNFIVGGYYLHYEAETHYKVYSSALTLYALLPGFWVSKPCRPISVFTTTTPPTTFWKPGQSSASFTGM